MVFSLGCPEFRFPPGSFHQYNVNFDNDIRNPDHAGQAHENADAIARKRKGVIAGIDTMGPRSNIVLAIRDKEFTGPTETVPLPSLP